MGIGISITPLDRFPFIRTTDVDEMREAIAKTHGENKLQLHRGAKGFHACGNRRVLRNIVLSYTTFGAAADQEFPAFTEFAQQLRIRGSSEIIVDRVPVQLGRVEVWRGGFRSNISVAAPFVWRCPTGSTLAPFPHPAHRTGHADFPHPQDITPSPTTGRDQAVLGKV
jgi:hypothetical protein